MKIKETNKNKNNLLGGELDNMENKLTEGPITSAIKKKISRRSFLRWSAAIGATSSITGLVLNTATNMAGAVDLSKSKAAATAMVADGGSVVDWIGTTCLVCHSWCQKAVGVDSDGIIRKIEGIGGQPKAGCVSLTNDTDAEYQAAGAGFLPYTLHNRGRICAKGNDGMEHAYDPDRVKYPLQRVGDRGSGKWKQITWNEAYTQISTVLRELAGKTTNADGANITASNYPSSANPMSFSGARAIDQRHRFVNYVGRNETGGSGGIGNYGDFTKAYGSPNHIEHTSLCELSRHVAHWLTFGDKFPLSDFQSHAGNITNTTIHNGAASDYDVDFYLNWGGNFAEATLPHTAYANRAMGMRRRGTRIVNIDVRQSNSGAVADESLYIKPGTDGALALGMIYYIMNQVMGDDATGTATKTALDAGHLDGKYAGLFASQEAGGAADDGTTPVGGSLQTYVLGGQYATDIGAAGNTWAQVKTALETLLNPASGSTVGKITGTDIEYLANAMAGAVVDGGSLRYNNPIADGYRGAAKHTNGAYSFRALRALQVLAGVANPSAKYRGGVDRPGGLMMDAWGGGAGGWQGASPAGFASGGAGGGSTVRAALPAETSKAGDPKQAIWSWDYENGEAKFKWAKARVDQMVVPAIRATLNMHAYQVGGVPPTYNLPYDDPVLDAGSGEYKVEALLEFKNSNAYSRPNIELDKELYTTKWTQAEIDANLAWDGAAAGDYKLRHHWCIDIAMGSGTKYADIILPDTTYLERYDFKDSWENFALKRHIQMRQPVIDNMYDTRRIKQILWELARYIEDPQAANNGAEAPWNGKLSGNGVVARGQYSWSGGTGDGELIGKANVDSYGANSLQATVENAKNSCNSASIPGADRDAKFQFMADHSVYWTDTTTPNYFPHGEKGAAASYTGGLKSSGVSRIEIYHKDLAATVDNSAPAGYIDGSNKFWGYPRYVPSTQQTGVVNGTNYDKHLTTYKLAVHTQSRTQMLPRLAEIINNNWAVMGVNGTDVDGTYALSSDGVKIRTGDTVRVSTAESSDKGYTFEIEAKVTYRAQPGCVHISHSVGHETAPAGQTYGATFGKYEVNGSVNRSRDRDSSVVDDYSNDLDPTAPGNGNHPNHIMNRTANAGLTTGTMNTDPIGGSVGWFDNKCRVVKVS